MNINSVTFSGRLTRDPEYRAVGEDLEVVKFGIAINERTKKGEKVLFLDCETWGSNARVARDYLHKGDMVGVIGSMRMDTWEKDGQKFNKLMVIADKIKLGPKPEGADNHVEGGGAEEAPKSRPAPAKAARRGRSPVTTAPGDIPPMF